MSYLERVVVLVDMDCFYCQVEENLNPHLHGKPIAVVQYNAWRGGGIIAVNYPARDCGVTRHMRGNEAKEKCPQIRLVKVPNVRGKADLTKYRDAGKRVAAVLQSFTTLLERASVDEAYLDITESVNNRMKHVDRIHPDQLRNTHVVDYDTAGSYLDAIYSSELMNENNIKLAWGGVIAEEIRAAVWESTGYRCSAGVAHNKILAKLVAGLHKPNQQTILPHAGVPVLFESMPVRKIQSLGGKFGNHLSEKLGIKNMGELCKFSEKELSRHFDEKTASWLYNIARGISNDPVTVRLVSKSIGCCKKFPGRTALTNHEAVKHWLNELAIEISERLEKDLEENNRKAKQMVVSFAQEVSRKDVSGSRSHTLNSYDANRIMSDAYEVVKKNCLRADDSFRIKFLGISVGKFEDVKNVSSIASFFNRSGKSGDFDNENNQNFNNGGCGGEIKSVATVTNDKCTTANVNKRAIVTNCSNEVGKSKSLVLVTNCNNDVGNSESSVVVTNCNNVGKSKYSASDTNCNNDVGNSESSVVTNCNSKSSVVVTNCNNVGKGKNSASVTNCNNDVGNSEGSVVVTNCNTDIGKSVSSVLVTNFNNDVGNSKRSVVVTNCNNVGKGKNSVSVTNCNNDGKSKSSSVVTNNNKIRKNGSNGNQSKSKNTNSVASFFMSYTNSNNPSTSGDDRDGNNGQTLISKECTSTNSTAANNENYMERGTSIKNIIPGNGGLQTKVLVDNTEYCDDRSNLNFIHQKGFAYDDNVHSDLNLNLIHQKGFACNDNVHSDKNLNLNLLHQKYVAYNNNTHDFIERVNSDASINFDGSNKENYFIRSENAERIITTNDFKAKTSFNALTENKNDSVEGKSDESNDSITGELQQSTDVHNTSSFFNKYMEKLQAPAERNFDTSLVLEQEDFDTGIDELLEVELNEISTSNRKRVMKNFNEISTTSAKTYNPERFTQEINTTDSEIYKQGFAIPINSQEFQNNAHYAENLNYEFHDPGGSEGNVPAEFNSSTTGLKRVRDEHETSTISNDGCKLCPECDTRIPISEFISHMDYHFALKMVRDEADLYRPVKIEKPATPKKGNKRKSSNPDNCTKLTSFLVPRNDVDDAVAKEICGECSKSIPIEDFASHFDYHVAKRIHLELNNFNTSDRANDGKPSVRKCDNKSSVKANVKKDKGRSITAFFKPV